MSIGAKNANNIKSFISFIVTNVCRQIRTTVYTCASIKLHFKCKVCTCPIEIDIYVRVHDIIFLSECILLSSDLSLNMYKLTFITVNLLLSTIG